MPQIELETIIRSDIEICFDLSRSIDLHIISTAQTNEQAVAGVTSGLINISESVTWEATHFGFRQKLTTEITAFKRPFYFRDEQIKGAFTFLVHDHFFESQGDKVVMKDIFNFKSPLGFIGRIADTFILEKYLTELLVKRNQAIKYFAESGKWESLLNER
ncbi:SRPBCC family protein [Pontibacter sp. BT310]|uniref:SRPBCC family protein n=1 Tax=Pontibacter populi TaxID=890055 RepID=A0ABS6XEX4_9BACT|nr:MULTISPECIES: SRPBCC family protein [Pontibacter]MBJ6118822.1 SRPBCC family protein [Pontibacter sp. BT310]MBR0571250.1 SRPBCC family protein [Microvirga sp. STS03]MBW3365676.1 SRPBCC family protein [Pontibacter populi]